ncbi:MAG: AAA family ATPase [Promethearchaeota archaeon]
MKTKIKAIAVTGKGGVGKTIFTYLLSQQLIEAGLHPLLVDGDPTTSHLLNILELSTSTDLSTNTLESIRKRIVKVAIQGNEDENQKVAENIDSIVSQSIIETEQFSLLVMGQPDLKGCFCASNVLLRDVISNVISKYDIILIDAEAGLEQIHRQVMGDIDYLIVLSDYSLRSVETANSIANSADKFIDFKKIGLVVNKKMGDLDDIFLAKIEEIGIPILGEVPFDEILMKIEQTGQSLSTLDKKSKAFKAIQEISQKMLSSD